MTGETERPAQSSGEQMLFAELRKLHLGAGEPSSRAVAEEIGGISHTTVNSAIRGRKVPSWPVLAKIVSALDGDEQKFRTLWSDARNDGAIIESLPAANSTARPEVSVFISYASVDDRATHGRIRSIAEGIRDMYESLTGETVGIFFDKESLAPGDDWRDRIRLGLSSSSVFLAFLSPSYIRSTPCNEEFWEFYRFLQENSNERLIIPLLFADQDRIGRVAEGSELWEVASRLKWIDVSELRLALVGERAWIEKTSKIAETVDAVLSSVAAKGRASADTPIGADSQDYDDLEPTLLEQMLKFEESAPEAQGSIERITDLLCKIGHQASGAAPLMNRASTIKRRLTLARQLAKSLSPLAQDMANEVAQLLRVLRIWDETISIVLNLLRRTPSLSQQYEVRNTLNAILEMSTAGIETFGQLETAHGQIGAARGLARELDIELRELQRIFLRLADARAIFEKWRIGVVEYL
jgi:hypothetical protein